MFVESPRKNKLTPKAKIITFYALAAVFIIIDCFLIAKYQTYAFNLLPVALIVIGAIFFAFDRVLLFSVMCIPFSIPIKVFYPDMGFNIDIPTEPLFVGVMLIFILKLLIEHKYDRKILKHPLSVMVIDLALSPKSNSAYTGLNLALQDIEKGNYYSVPDHIKTN